MARPATGSVVEHVARDGRIFRSLRFSAAGRRQFVSLGPVSQAEAERALRHALADADRGKWTPPKREQQVNVPSFHAFAETWWTLHVGEWAERTKVDYRWRIEKHLLPFFAEYRLDEITVDDVERYKAQKLAEGVLGARAINMTLVTLATILDAAQDRYPAVTRNVARGKQRRVKERAPARDYLGDASQIGDLLAATAELDRRAQDDSRVVHRRAIVTTLLFTGLRISELCDLRWRNVNLATGRVSVADSKTDAGVRTIKVRGIVRDCLLEIKPVDVDQDAFVFATARGGRPNPSNIRTRILAPAVELANEQRAGRGEPPLPHLTPHGCRRTFASILYGIGETPPTVMRQMGHTSPALALRIYAQAMDRDDDENARLKQLVEGVSAVDWADGADLAVGAATDGGAEERKNPA